MSARIAIIGCGNIGTKHAFGLRAAGANIVAAVARSAESKIKIVNDISVPVFATVREMFHECVLDAVVVSSPNYTHSSYTLEALRSGCHVLCEKPLAISSHDAQQMWQTSIAAGKCLMVAYNLRFARNTRIAAALCEEGRLGRILHAKCGWVRRRSIPGLGKWFTRRDLSGGGAMIDAGIHPLDLAWFLMGRPTPLSVSASTKSLFANRIEDYQYEKMWAGPVDLTGQMDVEDSCTAFIRFTNGATLQLEVAWATNGPESDCYCTLFGEDGGIAWSKSGELDYFDANGKESTICQQSPIGVWGTQGRIGKLARRLLQMGKGKTDAVIPGLPHYFPTMHQHFLQCVNGADCLSPARDGYILQCLLEAIYESARESREVPVNISIPRSTIRLDTLKA